MDSMSVHRICVHHVSVHSYSPSLSFLGRVGEGLKLYFYYFLLSTSYFTLHSNSPQEYFSGCLTLRRSTFVFTGVKCTVQGCPFLTG